MKQRLHITFGKFGALKYTGNLDIAKIWERVLRRAELPLQYTEGFNTRPRLQLATALPLGITSECEIIDVSLREVIPLDGLIERLLAVSPAGLRIYAIEDAPIRSPALQTLVTGAAYRIHFVDPIPPPDLQTRVDDLLGQERIVQVKMRRNRKQVTDLRPLIYALEIDDAGDLIATLATGERGNMRPQDVIEHLGLSEVHHTLHRFRLDIEDYR